MTKSNQDDLRNGCSGLNQVDHAWMSVLCRQFSYLFLMCLLCISLLSSSGRSQGNLSDATSDQSVDEAAERDSDSKSSERVEHPRPEEDARRTYLGRILAQPMSHLGANWLIRPERDQEENASLSFQQLQLKEGMTVCDFGCGNGYWTLPMAREVGSTGKVLAVDIQAEMLQKLRQRSAKFNYTHIEPIRSTVSDPKLPANEVDLLLMVDVYHEFSHPESMLWGIRRSLKPNGVVALLEYCLLYTSPSPRDATLSRMPSSA